MYILAFLADRCVFTESRFSVFGEVVVAGGDGGGDADAVTNCRED